jgi:hypothetical protein
MADHKELLLANAIKQLVGDDRFQMFIDAIKVYKDEAVIAACSNESLENPLTAAAALGHVRAYVDIFGLVEEARLKKETAAESI